MMRCAGSHLASSRSALSHCSRALCYTTSSSAMGKPRYYAIKSGWKTGVFFTDWDVARKYVEGYSKAVYKGFNSREAAETFVGGVATQASRRDEPAHGSTPGPDMSDAGEHAASSSDGTGAPAPTSQTQPAISRKFSLSAEMSRCLCRVCACGCTGWVLAVRWATHQSLLCCIIFCTRTPEMGHHLLLVCATV